MQSSDGSWLDLIAAASGGVRGAEVGARASAMHAAAPTCQQISCAIACARRSLSYIPEPDDTPLYSEQLVAPNRVKKIEVLQLDNLVRQHSLPRLVDSAAVSGARIDTRSPGADSSSLRPHWLGLAGWHGFAAAP
jgi:hypothetical protein